MALTEGNLGRNEDGLWSPPSKYLFGVLLLCGLALRLRAALQLGWYTDEGYVATLLQEFKNGGFPRLGGRWQDGFLPLSCSYLIPISQFAFAWIKGLNAMAAARLWGLVLEGLAIWLLALIGEASGSRRLGLIAAALYALAPFGIEFGGRAFYHHLGVVLSLFAYWSYCRWLQNPEASRMRRIAVRAAGAWASCYWIWWLPLGLGLAVSWKKREIPWRALLAGTTIFLGILALNFLPDPGATTRDFLSLCQLGGGDGPKSLSQFLQALFSCLSSLPFLWAGLLAGLYNLRWGSTSRSLRVLPFLFLSVGTFDPVRQRGDLSSMPYPLMLVLPWACLCGAQFFESLWQKSSLWPRALAFPLLVALLWPINFGWLHLQSLDPQKSSELCQYLDSRGKNDELVVGLPNFDWLLDGKLRNCEVAELSLWGGDDLRPGHPQVEGNFAYPCRLSDARFLVLCRLHVLSWFYYPGVAYCVLEAEKEGWPKVWDDGDFRVYENPRFGAQAQPGIRILQGKDFYLLAASTAEAKGELELQRYALSRAIGALPSLRSKM